MPTYVYIESYYKCIGKESTSSEQFFPIWNEKNHLTRQYY